MNMVQVSSNTSSAASSMFFCLASGETMSNTLTRREHYLKLWLSINKDHKILDFGCGNGGPTREIARFLGVNDVGIDLGQYLIQQARNLTAAAKLEVRVSFVAADFLDIRFEDASFDGAYAIEATAYAPDLQAVYAEISRVLRPGARFAVYESVLASKYHDDVSNHRVIRSKYEQVFGAPPLRKVSPAIEEIKAAEFELEVAEDLAERPK